ncbi:MAG: thermonuclease family protein [Pseudomonadota bacterium]
MSAPTQLRRPAAARSAAVALAAAAALCAAPATATATATTLEGAAQVVDGDTLRLGAAPVRLEGLDAPERDQTCQDARGHAYPCGEAAAEALRGLIRGRDVRCEIRGADVYGRSLAVCTAAGRDLARDMVLAGWARAGDKLADRYAAQEAAARTARRGLWAGRFQDPWDWRADRREARAEAETAERADGCVLKGNISESGRLFHVPGQRWYDRTRIDAAEGERWFCSPQEARAAGWRPAKR